MNRGLAILPLLALIGFGAVGAVNLQRDKKPSVALSTDRQAPSRIFETMIGAEPEYDFSKLAADINRPIAINLFASWCAPCRVEHPLLMQLEQSHPDQLYGVLYEDASENGRAFLSEFGNPFKAVVLDPIGDGGLDFGLTGVPETFIIGTNGQILLHVRGVITPDIAREISELLTK